MSITAGEQPGRNGVPGSGSVDLVVEVPEAATVVLDAASADIEAEHLVGESRLRDGIQYALLSSVFNTQSAIRRMLGRGVRDNSVSHAPA